MNWLQWSREPVIIIGLIEALITVGSSFGVSLTEAQHNALILLVTAVGTFITRSQVSPTGGLSQGPPLLSAQPISPSPVLPPPPPPPTP